MNHLQDKVVVITGASSGIGAVSAKALAAHGATIVAAARGQEDLDQLVADINKAGGTAAARLTDVTDAADAADMQALADFTVATGWADKVTDPAGRRAAQELNSIAISAQSVADAVVYALDQPVGVTVNDLIISPTRQNW
ncbi:SDR family NAD(P)-dependent oxidoreductase [Streptomyces sp. B21-079]|uniref:SDR family NAD(P)-dependent oxidoreductase n=1 Tax=Streptomyces sp. B21-079 TaxID=3039409 RepID=UPI002FF038B1